MSGAGGMLDAPLGTLGMRRWDSVSPNGATIVLLHGFLTWSFTWRKVGPALAAAGYEVIALDLPGSGESPAPKDGVWSAARAALLVDDIVGRLDRRNVVLVGSQMGGSIAAWVAALRPSRYGALVIAAAGALGETAKNGGLFRLLAHPVFGDAVCRFFPRSLFRKKWLLAHGSAYQPEEGAIAAYWQHLRRRGSAQVRFALEVRRSYGARFDELEPLLGGIGIPTLLVWGEEDRVVPKPAADRFHRLIRGSTLALLSGCGDFPQEERPDEFAAMVATFAERALARGPDAAHGLDVPAAAKRVVV